MITEDFIVFPAKSWFWDYSNYDDIFEKLPVKKESLYVLTVFSDTAHKRCDDNYSLVLCENTNKEYLESQKKVLEDLNFPSLKYEVGLDFSKYTLTKDISISDFRKIIKENDLSYEDVDHLVFYAKDPSISFSLREEIKNYLFELKSVETIVKEVVHSLKGKP